jgi:hypothetical protein
LPAVVVAVVLAGCGSSHSSAPPTTTSTIPTIPKKTLELAVQKFPQTLDGSISFTINRIQGKPNRPHGWKRRYSVTLDHIVLHLTGTSGKGDQRKARYNLVKAHESFTGSETLTNAKCQTTRIVWAGSDQAPTGTVELFGPKFDAQVGFVFLVPQRGTTTTRPCRSSSGGQKSSVTRTARIEGNANLKLVAAKNPAGRFSIGVEVQSSTAGPDQSGGYTINGELAPPASASNPVQICRSDGGKLDCPA